jgi:hypothetical protein
MLPVLTPMLFELRLKVWIRPRYEEKFTTDFDMCADIG